MSEKSDTATKEPEAQTKDSKTVTAKPEDIALKIEAALLTTDRPLPTGKLSEILGKVAGKSITGAIELLNKAYDKSKRSFRIEQVAGGWQVMTLPEFSEVLSSLHKTRAQTRLSPAAMETLAIIAYRQPILRAEIEAIRGVACGEVLRSLMERRLVKIAGRSDELGRPMLYGTTAQFLEVFGLSNLKDLPKVEELKAPIVKKQPEPEQPNPDQQPEAAESDQQQTEEEQDTSKSESAATE